MRRVLTIAILVLAAGAGIVAASNAQGARDKLIFRNLGSGLQAYVVSSGRTLAVGVPNEVGLQGELVDLDGDGANDVILESLWDDGSTYSVWLKRGDAYVVALEKIEFVATTVGHRNFDGDGVMEIVVPPPTEQDVFDTLWRQSLGRDAADELNLWKLRKDTYERVPIACLLSARAKYVAILEKLAKGLADPKRVYAATLNEPSDLATKGLVRKSVISWLNKLAEGCGVG